MNLLFVSDHPKRKGDFQMSAFMGEIIGTMILIVFGGGVVAGANLKRLSLSMEGGLLSPLPGD